jgi:hypothetical protein
MIKFFNFCINFIHFAPLHVLGQGWVPHLPHFCYGFDSRWLRFLWVNSGMFDNRIWHCKHVFPVIPHSASQPAAQCDVKVGQAFVWQYKTSAVFLYGYETWYLSWWQIEAFKNKVLQITFGCKKEELTRGRGLIECMGKQKLHKNILVCKPQVKIPLGRHLCRCEG